MKQPLDHLRSKKKPIQVTVYIAADSDMADKVHDLDQEVKKLQMMVKSGAVADAPERLEAKEAELKELRRTLEEDALKFKFRSLSRKAYDDLIGEHQATDEQKAQNDGELPFNPDVFPLELVIACMVEPEIDKSNPHEVQELREWLSSEAWNQAELMQLFNACLQVNTTSKVVHLGKG